VGRHRARCSAIGVIVISIAMLVFAGCTLVSARAAAAVAAVSLPIVAAWVRRHAAGRTGL
jgi:hypothetical protein